MCLKVYRLRYIPCFHESVRARFRTENLQIRLGRGKPANVSEGHVVGSVECSVLRPHQAGNGEPLKVLRHTYSHWDFTKIIDYCVKGKAQVHPLIKTSLYLSRNNVGTYVFLEDNVNLPLFSTHYLTPTIFSTPDVPPVPLCLHHHCPAHQPPVLTFRGPDLGSMGPSF